MKLMTRDATCGNSRPFEKNFFLRCGHAFEQATDHHTKCPPI